MTSGILAGIIRGMYLGYGSKRRHLCVCVCVCVWSSREGERKTTELERYPGLACPKDIWSLPS